MQNINILLVDDHKVVRDGIKYMLKLNEKFSAEIEEAEDGEEAIEKATNKDFDVIIMDIKMPKKDGIEACREIVKSKPDSRILGLSMYDETAQIIKMLKAGALGYVLKNTGEEELNTAIATVMKNKKFFSNEVAVKLIEPLQQESMKQQAAPVQNIKSERKLLSKREIEILTMIAGELTNEEIALKLDIKKRTVDSHRQNIINKLRVKNTAGLIKYALQQNMVR